MMIGFMTLMWQFNRNELCRLRVHETLEWLLREMSLDGAFASGITAFGDGEEGKYHRLERGGNRCRPGRHLLGPLQAGLWCRAATAILRGKNLLRCLSNARANERGR